MVNIHFQDKSMINICFKFQFAVLWDNLVPTTRNRYTVLPKARYLDAGMEWVAWKILKYCVLHKIMSILGYYWVHNKNVKIQHNELYVSIDLSLIHGPQCIDIN